MSSGLGDGPGDGVSARVSGGVSEGVTGRASGPEPWRATVVTVSTSAARDGAPDRSGPILVDGLRALDLDVTGPVVVPDGRAVAAALEDALAPDPAVVLLTGGTGPAPDDRTPEHVVPALDRQLPGIVEALRADGVARGVPTAMLSRGVAGVAGRTLVVTLPGSTGACRDALRVLGPIVHHAVAMIRNEPVVASRAGGADQAQGAQGAGEARRSGAARRPGDVGEPGGLHGSRS